MNVLHAKVEGKHEAGLGADELSRALSCSVLVAKERHASDTRRIVQ